MTTPPAPHTPADEQWVDVAPLLTQIRLAARMDHAIAALDVPLPELERRIAQEKFAARMGHLPWLLTHPEAAATAQPAPAGERAEWSHILHDADEDAATRPFVYLKKGTKS